MAGKHPKRLPRPGVDEYGRTPLMNAVVDGGSAEIGSLLVSAPRIDDQDDDGWTALHFAAAYKRVDIVRLLIAHGANPNLQDRHGNGPLWVAVMNAKGELEVVTVLLAAGADPKSVNRYGKSPREMAHTFGGELAALI